jgi:hypothetical protein
MRVEPAGLHSCTLAGHSATLIFRLRDRLYEEISSGRGGATIRCCHPLVPCRMLLAHRERAPLQILKTRRRRLAELLFSSWTRSHSVLSHSGNGGDREPGEIRAVDRRIVSTEG